MRVGTSAVEGPMDAWPSVPQAVDGSAKKFSLLRKLWPFATAAVRLAWAWRWPALVIAAPLIVLAVFGLATAGLVVSPVATVAGPWRSVFLRARFGRAVVRTREIGWDLYWPFLCSLAGLVEVAGRRVRVAGLEGIEFGSGWVRPSWIRFRVAPCSTHDKSTWDRYEDRIRRRLRYGASTWTAPASDPNVMVITIRRDPLPTMWALGDQVTETMLTAPSTEFAGDGPGRTDAVYLGIGADGNDIVWRPDEAGKAMLFIAGRQGGGKGLLAKLIMVKALMCGWRIRVCNPKRVGEFRWLGASASVAKTPAGMFAMIAQFRAELERRADLLDEVFGVAGWNEVPLHLLRDHGMAHRELLVVDEFVSLMATKGIVPVLPPPLGAPKGSRPIDPYAVMVGDLQAIAAMGRALGMSLVVITQHPIAEHMGPFGSTVKANMGARIGVGSLEPEGAGSLFGKGQGEAIYQILRAGTPGRCVYEGLTTTTDGAGWKLGQAVYATPPQLQGFLPAEPTHLPVDYDTPPPTGPNQGDHP